MVLLTPSWLREEGLGWVLDSWALFDVAWSCPDRLQYFPGLGSSINQSVSTMVRIGGAGLSGDGLGLRSRALIITGFVHLLAIGILPSVGAMQFLGTGIMMGGSSILLAVFQWDSFGACGGEVKS
jgi:hypothetical protein